MTDQQQPQPRPPKSKEQPTILDRFNTWIAESMSLRLVIIGILILILLIPLEMVQGLIRERTYRMDEAKQEVSHSWANDQVITGPIISIPYTDYDEKGQVYENGNVHVLPEMLDVKAELTPEIRKRGIFEIPVYQSENELTFRYSPEPIDEYATRKIHWERASLLLGISDTRGITEELDLMINGTPIEFDPGLPNHDVFSSGISTPIEINWGDSVSTSFEGTLSLNLRGSNSLKFIPIGKTTSTRMTSTWPHPSFVGSFLPTMRDITNDGFEAEWKVLEYNRNFSQVFYNEMHLGGSAYGVDLYMPVNHYQKSERSAKYAVMMIALTFILFFFSQAINKVKIHPFQYFLVGLALCLFYTLLLSLSEHVGFNWAYIISAGMILGLITLYMKKLLGSTKFTLITAGVLGGLYLYIFTLLQLQDYALLIGSIGLFLILAMIMWLSAKINWSGKPTTT